MGEFTARVRITPQVSEFLKNHAISPELLSPLIESFWKPKGINLRDFPPGRKAIRIFQETSRTTVVEELNFFLKDGSYTDSRVELFEGNLPESEVFFGK